ncbi:MAG: Ldh family oxidoreductase [Smithellaceae bacterium]|nr:Ldh family oxidoreductase [Smithellaceae bacterium]
MRVSADLLKEAAIRILKGLKAGDEEARVVADALVRADARGIDTHGVHLLTLMAERVAAGMIRIPTEVRLISDDAATALLDGGNGLGQLAARQAMNISIEKAKTYGLGCCLLRNTNNIGILSLYSLQAARERMVGIVMSNAAASMSPWGGAQAMLGTNPISIALPGGKEPPVALDMSSTVVARGKIRRAMRLKEALPQGWALDAEGEPTTDATRALKGTLVPVGGPKGYGLALAVDLLAGLISGSKYGPNINSFHELKGPTGVGVFTMAIDIARFLPYEGFEVLAQSYLASIKSSKKARGVTRIYLPGEIEFEKEKASFLEGIEINPALAEKLNQLLAGMGSPIKLEE